MTDRSDDFRDLLVEFHLAGVEFLAVGGYAVSFHGHPRATKDLDGCYYREGCEGVATSCASLFSRFSCEDQDGCYWSSDRCTGVARSCILISDSLRCSLHRGCQFERDCSGVAYPCSSYASLSSCISQPGCDWVDY